MGYLRVLALVTSLLYLPFIPFIRGNTVKLTNENQSFIRALLNKTWLISSSIYPGNDEEKIAVKGKVLNEAGNPIAYVNIGIPETTIGTVSSGKGNFKITLNGSHKNDTLKFSAVGYQTRQIPIEEAKQKDSFILQEKIYQSEAVTVSGQKGDFQTKKLGDWKPLIGYNYRCYSPEGCKMATRLDMDVDSAYVKKVRVFVKKNEDTSVRARAWVYNIKEGKPGKHLVKEPVIQKVPIGTGWMVFDLSKQYIQVHKDFFVGIEFLGGNSNNKDGPYVGSRLEGDVGKSWQMFYPTGGWRHFDDEYVMQAIIQY